MSKEINTFLSKIPLKMAASTIYSLKKLEANGDISPILNRHPHLGELMKEDVSFLDGYYSPSLDLLPVNYKSYTENRLNNFVQILKDTTPLHNFDVSITEE